MPRQEMPGHLRMKLQALRAIVTDAAAVTAAAAAYSTTGRPAAASGRFSSTHGALEDGCHCLSYLKGTAQRSCWS